MASETTDSSVGLRRRNSTDWSTAACWWRRPESHRRGRAYEARLGARTLSANRSCRREDSNLHYVVSQTTDSAVGLRRHLRAGAGGDAGTRTQLSTSAADLQSAPVTLPSTAPWGDRWDSHPFGRGSRPRSSTASDSITVSVRPEGLAPSSLGYRPSALLFELREVSLELHPDVSSTWLDLHQRSLGSEPSALAAGLHVERTGPDRGPGEARRQ